MAKIVIRRKSSVVGAAQSYDVYLMNNYIGELKNGGTIEIPVDVGTHHLSFNTRIKLGGKNVSFNCVVNYPNEVVELEAKFSVSSGDFVVEYADNAPHIPVAESQQTQLNQQPQSSHYNTAPIAKPKSKAKKFIKRIWISLVVIIVLSIFIALLSDDDSTSTNNTTNNDTTISSTVETTEVETTIPYIEITANELWNEFNDNEMAAEKKYNGKTLKITGIISDINSANGFIDANILLDVNGSYLGCVQCNFNSSDKAEILADLEKGRSVTIIGTCDSMSTLDTNVMISGCEVLE